MLVTMRAKLSLTMDVDGWEENAMERMRRVRDREDVLDMEHFNGRRRFAIRLCHQS